MRAERRKTYVAGLLSALFIAGCLTAPRAVLAQKELANDPGFVDFSRQQTLSDDELEIHISVKDPMIKLVAEATRESDPALADVLEQLQAVEVYVYQVPSQRQSTVRKEISALAGNLADDGWTEAIAIRMKGARGHVFLRLVDGKPVGLAAMYSDDEGEAVFVNIVGQIDAAQIGRIATKFDLEVLGKALNGAAR